MFRISEANGIATATPTSRPPTTPSSVTSTPTSRGRIGSTRRGAECHADADLAALRFDDPGDEVERRERGTEEDQ